MIEKIYILNGDPRDSAEAIRITGDTLNKEGCVKNTFVDACLEREKMFPTGLPTEIGIAIPHCDSIHVNKSAICLLRPKQPVMFENMGGDEEPVKCELVMNLALKKQSDQVVLLGRIINMVQDKEVLKSLINEKPKKAEEIIRFYLENNEQKETLEC